ncbi:TadE/TadG family type IV pilus assembly protein [Yoonia maritima]|uniref:TadE/TadG family type IV pilus assembly protein n=1 Tax=Yoonia maritima TaxID=1435347 RepID=UPI0013A62AC0|nr:Tad domain-containing protein [Yoonia maritima]
MYKSNSRNSRARDQQINIAKRFVQDEDGSILIMTILLLVTMLIMGGMAVDFMRFESRRAEIQGVADRAVLAAANLIPTGAKEDEAVSREEIALDYFRKAGLEDVITSGPRVITSGGSSSAYVEAEVDINTYYLRLAGIDHLSAPAESRAIQGNGKTEVSLVLDISGSMRFNLHNDYDASSFANSRMYELQTAAKDFVTKVLEPNGAEPAADASEADIAAYAPRVSLNLVTYSGHVNVGKELFDQLNVDIDEATGNYGVDNSGDYLSRRRREWGTITNESQCVIFPDSAYTTLGYSPTSAPLRQVADADYVTSQGRVFQNYRLCRSDETDEAIIVHAHQAGAINTAIGNLVPRASTSIHLGMKWGVTLLDPSMETIVSNLSTTHETFQNDRPSPYVGSSADASLKYIVLMTDGDNTSMSDIRKSSYNEAREIHRLREWTRWSSNDVETITTGTKQDTLLQNICTEAKDAGVVVYTITMSSNALPLDSDGAIDRRLATNGQQAMHDCATSPSHFYSSQSQDLSSIFNSIAEQITELRLNL